VTDTLVPTFDYAPAPTPRETAALRERYGLFVGGAWCDAAGGTFVTFDPATERPLAEVARASDDDVDKAVRLARRGYEKYWRKLRPSERAKHLFRFALAAGERARELAPLEALDAGTPIRQARASGIPDAVATLFHYAGWADKLAWALRPGERARPLGVVASIAAGPSPLLAAAVAIGPALACGNTVVLMPAEAAPLGALALAQAALEADLPPGVLSVVTGDAHTRTALADDPGVDGVEFAGSRAAGSTLARNLAGTPKRPILRLDSPGLLIVYDDAPLEQAVEGMVRAAFMHRGPFAPAAARMLVQESVLATVLQMLEERLATLRHGDPLDENTDVGPLLSRRERETAENFVRAAVEEGARLLQPPWLAPELGFWHPATIVAGVQPPQSVARTEPPASVVPVLSFRTVEESLERAGGFGPARGAGIWTSSLQLAAFAAGRLRTPSVWCDAFDRYDPAGAGVMLREYLNP